MTRRFALAILFIAPLLALPASAQSPGQLQYFGYVGNGDDDFSLDVTKGFTNFTHIWARDSPTDPFVRDRVPAIAQRGLKATIDLGRIFWCDYDLDGVFHYRCTDWQTRWQQWKTFNASILSSDKVLAFSVLDEPFNRGVDMAHFEEVVQTVKTDFPWAKVFLVEAACVVMGECGFYPYAYSYYNGTLPGVDWLGLDAYGQYPSTNTTFLNARAELKSRFPGRKWLYVMDAHWNPDLHPQYMYYEQMDSLAQDWYQVASADSDAVLLGGFYWGPIPSYGLSAQQFPCSVLSHHVAIGRAITGKTRAATALPTGILVNASRGFVTGWACDPDGTLCERPRIDLYVNGTFAGQASYDNEWRSNIQPDASCGAGVRYFFKKALSSGTSGAQVTAVARDLDSGSVTLPSACPENPACVW